MKIKYSPAVDLCCAMLQYAHWNEATSGISGYTVSEELGKWYRRISNEISGILDNDINYLIRNFLGLTFLPVELALSTETTSASELIALFRSLPPQTLPRRLYATYAVDQPFDQIKDNPEAVIRTIEKAGGTTRKQEPQLFLEFIRNPEAMQKRLAYMMEEFYRLAVKPYEQQIIRIAEQQAACEQQILDEDPDRFFSGFCRISRAVGEPVPQIYISYYNEIDIIQIDNPLCLIYGRCRRMLENVGTIPLEQIYALLADESRRSILKQLCRKPRFIRDLADQLDLTSATVSYHMSRLTALNLVTYERGERKRVYYKADRAMVETMLGMVENDILG